MGRRLLAKDPQLRLTTEEFLYHPFLSPGALQEVEILQPPNSEASGLNCPKCFKRESVLCDVTMGATHESWGNDYTTCYYKCVHCQGVISPGLSVDLCSACKCFWHRGSPESCKEYAVRTPSSASPVDAPIDSVTIPLETFTVDPVVEGKVMNQHWLWCC